MQKNDLKYIINKIIDEWTLSFIELTPKIIVGLLIFLFFLLMSKYISLISVKLLQKVFPKSKKQGSLTTLISLFKFLIILMGTFISLEIMGFSGFLWKFIGSLGVAGVIAGVALKGLVSSMFSGMLIGIDKAFKVGDYIMIGNNSGTVKEIGFLTTKIITDDGSKAYIPNQLVFSAPFHNYTASPKIKAILELEIPADQDIYNTKKGILEVIKNLENIDQPDAAEIVFTSLKQGIFTLQVKFWITVGSSSAQVKSNAYMGIKKKMDENNINLGTPNIINTINNENESFENNSISLLKQTS